MSHKYSQTDVREDELEEKLDFRLRKVEHVAKDPQSNGGELLSAKLVLLQTNGNHKDGQGDDVKNAILYGKETNILN